MWRTYKMLTRDFQKGGGEAELPYCRFFSTVSGEFICNRLHLAEQKVGGGAASLFICSWFRYKSDVNP